MLKKMYKYNIYRKTLIILAKTMWPTKFSFTQLFMWIVYELPRCLGYVVPHI